MLHFWHYEFSSPPFEAELPVPFPLLPALNFCPFFFFMPDIVPPFGAFVEPFPQLGVGPSPIFGR